MAIIFAIYAAAVVFWSPVVSSKLLMNYSGQKLIPLGMLLLGLAYLLFAFIPYFEGNNLMVFIWACLCRIIHGIASSTMQVTAYAVGTNDFPHRRELVVGGIEVITGIGGIVGPLVAGPIC
jgi:MFS family permease